MSESIGHELTERDRQLVDRVRELRRYLNRDATVRLATRENNGEFTEGLRELGHLLHDLGRDVLIRVNALDGAPFRQVRRCRRPGESEEWCGLPAGAKAMHKDEESWNRSRELKP
ncbi:hypothetical protein [Amycolatopsis cihanbeyliensis]|uniref:Uncharacterized protein n=1 Tax=Amycolatopsis cihanbeyliensis TaxID=1128664 RepID=A0A542DII8_AMYCI|nr:hypothetical protein [Amycolatopsis cihanbeyliensis]TQJ02866.1 hypothetical protein FB471_2614 [Amycolatopsis cihanbeyliensis]